MSAKQEWEHPREMLGLPEAFAVSDLINEDEDVKEFVAGLMREKKPMLSCLSDGALVRLFACLYCRKDYEYVYALILNAVMNLQPEALVELRVSIGLPHFRV